jgi:hypothetical protein
MQGENDMHKLLMNCDQVFDVLTRGPFPTGDDSDESVERHLRACHECRQLAEALQPAVELLHESLGREDAINLPEYQGLLAVVERSVATAEQPRKSPLAVRQLSRAPVALRRAWTAVNVAQAAIVLVMLLAVGSLVWNASGVPDQTAMLVPHGAAQSVRLDDRGLLTLASLDLPAQCFPGDALVDTASQANRPTPLSSIDQDALQCCTQCHNPSQPGRPAARTVAAMQRSCVACHAL